MKESPAAVFERLSSTTRPAAGEHRLRRAVVLGGSIAGIMAARVLADHADEVVVVERDDLTAGRRGVPQATQVHALLPGGLDQIERWFPGYAREAVEAGATLSRPDQVQNWTDNVQGVLIPNARLLSGSRSFLEALLRRRTLAHPNVRVVTGAATGLEYAAGRVGGVRYLPPSGGGERRLAADFVVDAMGRAGKLPDWLERDGWERPELERMRIDVNYATAYFKRSLAEPPVVAAISRFSPGYPKETQAATAAIEDGQWMLMLSTYGTDRAIREPAEFAARCTELPPVFAAVAREERIGDLHTYRQGDARRRRWDKPIRLPAGLVSVGDAVASFNPVYGQGMSSATLHASCLSEYLRGPADLAEPAREFFRLQKVVVDAAWSLSTSGDAQRLETTKPPIPVRLQRALINHVIRAAVVDSGVSLKFNAVAFMRAHPSTLAAPSVLLRSILVNLRRRRA